MHPTVLRSFIRSAVMLATLVSGVAGSAGCGNPLQPSSASSHYLLRLELNCTGLPADVATRTYVVALTGTSATLSGATFWMSPSGALRNRFRMTIDGDAVALAFDPSPHGVVEQTTPGTFLSLAGESRGTITRTRRDVVMAGAFNAQVLFGRDLADTASRTPCSSSTTSTFRLTTYDGDVPVAGVAPALLRVLLQTPETLVPQRSATLGVLGQFADGSTRDVATEGRWQSSDPDVIAVDAGRATGMTTGEATVSVEVPVPNANPVAAERLLYVLPDGTYRLEGWVWSGPGGSEAVAGAVATVIAGSTPGVTSTTDSTGWFAFYGLKGAATIEFSKPGFTTWSCVVPAIVAHQSWTVLLSPPPRSGSRCERIR